MSSKKSEKGPLQTSVLWLVNVYTSRPFDYAPELVQRLEETKGFQKVSGFENYNLERSKKGAINLGTGKSGGHGRRPDRRQLPRRIQVASPTRPSSAHEPTQSLTVPSCTSIRAPSSSLSLGHCDYDTRSQTLLLFTSCACVPLM